MLLGWRVRRRVVGCVCLLIQGSVIAVGLAVAVLETEVVDGREGCAGLGGDGRNGADGNWRMEGGLLGYPGEEVRELVGCDDRSVAQVLEFLGRWSALRRGAWKWTTYGFDRSDGSIDVGRLHLFCGCHSVLQILIGGCG